MGNCWRLRYLRDGYSEASLTNLFSQYFVTAVETMHFHLFFVGLCLRTSSGDGRSYLMHTFLIIIGEPASAAFSLQ